MEDLDFQGSVINLFSYLFLSIFFFIVGAGDKAFAISYILCLLLVQISFYVIFSKDFLKIAIGSMIFWIGGLFFSFKGGVFDLRLDIISVSMCIFSLAWFRKERYELAFFNLFVSSFFKSSAFFLLFPFFSFVILLNIYVKKGIQFKKTFLINNEIVFARLIWFKITLFMGVLFFHFSFLRSFSYNLLGAGGENLNEKIVNAFSTALKPIDRSYYYAQLLWMEDIWTLILVVIFLTISGWRVAKKKTMNKQATLVAILFLVYSYALLTLNPQHSEVLKIWMAPALFLVSIEIAEYSSLLRKMKRIFQLLLFILIVAAFYRSLPPPKPTLEKIQLEEVYKFRQISNETRDYIIKNFKEYSRIFVLGNFAASEFMFPNYTDTFRAILHESFKSIRFKIDSGEFISFEKDMWQEIFLIQYLKYDNVFLFLQANPEGIKGTHRVQKIGKIVYTQINNSIQKNPECYTLIADTVFLKTGQTKILHVSKKPKCKERIFNELNTK